MLQFLVGELPGEPSHFAVAGLVGDMAVNPIRQLFVVQGQQDGTLDAHLVADAVEGDGFVLEIFNESAFQIGIEIVLKKDVESFDDDLAVWWLRRSGRISR